MHQIHSVFKTVNEKAIFWRRFLGKIPGNDVNKGELFFFVSAAAAEFLCKRSKYTQKGGFSSNLIQDFFYLISDTLSEPAQMTKPAL
jgi:hypothetical protein